MPDADEFGIEGGGEYFAGGLRLWVCCAGWRRRPLRIVMFGVAAAIVPIIGFRARAIVGAVLGSPPLGIARIAAPDIREPRQHSPSQFTEHVDIALAPNLPARIYATDDDQRLVRPSWRLYCEIGVNESFDYVGLQDQPGLCACVCRPLTDQRLEADPTEWIPCEPLCYCTLGREGPVHPYLLCECRRSSRAMRRP